MDSSSFLGIDEFFDLHGAIEDATGRTLALFFAPTECLEGYFQIMKEVCLVHSVPISVYNDQHTSFVSPNDGKLTVEEQLEGKQVRLTQFGRALDELGIRMIKAGSPQAKGRIERLWGTLQSRLPVEFEAAGISTLEAANAFLKTITEATTSNSLWVRERKTTKGSASVPTRSTSSRASQPYLTAV